MATEEKESDKKNKRGPKAGAKPSKKPEAPENKEKQVQKDSEATEVKPKKNPKPKKGKKEDAPAAEEPKQKKKGRPSGRKPAKGGQKKEAASEQQPLEKAASARGGEEKEKAAAPEATTTEVTAASGTVTDTAVPPAKTPQGGRGKKKRGSGKKRGSQKPATPQKEDAAIEGKAQAEELPEVKKADVPAPEATVAEAPEATAPAPVKEAPRKKKGRPKKSAKKKETATPPPPVVEEPINIQENKVVIASRNPAKIKAVQMAYGRLFPDDEFVFESVSVPVGVSDQPMSDDETFAGALFRAQMAREEIQDAGYYVGLEGGIEEIGDELQAFGWMVVLSHDSKIGKARTSTFVLPYAVAEMIRDGKELGEADDVVFGKTNSKLDQGAVGILTHGLIDRAQFYAEAVIMALIPFKNPEYYSTESLETV